MFVVCEFLKQSVFQSEVSSGIEAVKGCGMEWLMFKQWPL